MHRPVVIVIVQQPVKQEVQLRQRKVSIRVFRKFVWNQVIDPFHVGLFGPPDRIFNPPLTMHSVVLRCPMRVQVDLEVFFPKVVEGKDAISTWLLTRTIVAIPVSFVNARSIIPVWSPIHGVCE